MLCGQVSNFIYSIQDYAQVSGDSFVEPQFTKFDDRFNWIQGLLNGRWTSITGSLQQQKVPPAFWKGFNPAWGSFTQVEA